MIEMYLFFGALFTAYGVFLLKPKARAQRFRPLLTGVLRTVLLVLLWPVFAMKAIKEVAADINERTPD